MSVTACPRDPDAFDLGRFHIGWDHRQVICPNGKPSRNWRDTSDRQGCPSCR